MQHIVTGGAWWEFVALEVKRPYGVASRFTGPHLHATHFIDEHKVSMNRIEYDQVFLPVEFIERYKHLR